MASKSINSDGPTRLVVMRATVCGQTLGSTTTQASGATDVSLLAEGIGVGARPFGVARGPEAPGETLPRHSSQRLTETCASRTEPNQRRSLQTSEHAPNGNRRLLAIFGQRVRIRPVGLSTNSRLKTPQFPAFEVNLATGRMDQAAENLLRLSERVDHSKAVKPAVLAVITSTGYGYRREDGVWVVPIDALGP